MENICFKHFDKKRNESVAMLLWVLFTLISVLCPCSGFEPRIVGGHNAQTGEFPFMCSLQVFGTHLCGASLVSEEFVLTAAHCVGKQSFFQADTVVCNRRRLYEQEDAENGTEVRGIEMVKIHPRYVYDTGKNDIAIIKLDAPIKTIRPINLVGSDQYEFEGNMLQVIGYGTVKETSWRHAGMLLKIDVPVVSLDRCKMNYANFSTKAIAPTNICMGYEEGGIDSCSGDSGGPSFFHDNVTNEFYQVGIVSWGIGCARPGLFGVYTRVSAFLGDFINKRWGGIEVPETRRPTIAPSARPTKAPTTLRPTSTPDLVDDGKDDKIDSNPARRRRRRRRRRKRKRRSRNLQVLE